MAGPDRDRTKAGFRERTPVAEARTILQKTVTALEGPEAVSIPVADADGWVLAEPIVSGRDVPHYDRAAMDGYAVRASDTFGATDRSPAVLREDGARRDYEIEGGVRGDVGESPDHGDGGESPDHSDVGESHGVDRTDAQGKFDDRRRVDTGTAVRVHTGSPIPHGADAVVTIERTERLESTGEVEVLDAVAVGENVAQTGEDVTAGQRCFDAGHRLRPSDLGLCKSIGETSVPVVERPTVAVIPTGEEVVETDPGRGEVVETNGLTVARLVERWGGRADRHPIVDDDPAALREAIERRCDRDVVVTTGGSSVGERDRLPEVIEELGEVLVHGVALKPGHPVALGIVEETPVLALPGYPVASLVNAVQFLRPTIRWLEGAPIEAHPTIAARLERKIPSEPGTRTFARVRLEDGDDESIAVPTRASGAGVLSSVALADGWVVVEESLEGMPAGAVVSVERWE